MPTVQDDASAGTPWAGQGGRTPAPGGIHHVSVIGDDPDDVVGFYRDGLGLRPVKRTVNYDDPEVYHLYFGDGAGTLGTTLTVFPTPGDPPGRVGRGQPDGVSLAVPEGSLAYWRDRLAGTAATVRGRVDRFGDAILDVRAPDGLPLELVGVPADDDRLVDDWTHWADGPVPAVHGVRGLAGVRLRSAVPVRTGALLETFGFEQVGESPDRSIARFQGAGDRPAVVDLRTDPDGAFGRDGPGTIHHVALTVPDDESLLGWRGALFELGLEPTHPRDRTYFRSVYVRDPGGILFELATPDPGLTADEPVESLAGDLRLPTWLAADRDRIESQLPAMTAFDEPSSR